MPTTRSCSMKCSAVQSVSRGQQSCYKSWRQLVRSMRRFAGSSGRYGPGQVLEEREREGREEGSGHLSQLQLNTCLH